MTLFQRFERLGLFSVAAVSLVALLGGIGTSLCLCGLSIHGGLAAVSGLYGMFWSFPRIINA